MTDKGGKIWFVVLLIVFLLLSGLVGWQIADKLENSRIGAEIEYWLSDPNERK